MIHVAALVVFVFALLSIFKEFILIYQQVSENIKSVPA